MAQFNVKGTRPTVTSPLTSAKTPTTTTYNGAPGYTRDTKSEVFLLGIANMFNTDTFYEKGQDRDARFKKLIRDLAIDEPEWTANFLKWLRHDANMRTISLVGAAEFVKGRLDYSKALKEDWADGLNRQVIDSVLVRADEPGEMIGYWHTTYGRKIPKPVKRGVADAATRLYSEYTTLKYDTPSHAIRFGDVLELTHPEPKAPWQGDLFKFIVDRRHGNASDEAVDGLPMVSANQALRKWSDGNLDSYTNPNVLKAAGMTWEDVLSLAGSKVDKKALWEALIPTMGIMALVRNLRNFDQAGVSDEAVAYVVTKLQDPEVIAKSRMFPFRFLAASLHAPSLRWQYPLSKALDLSMSNVPFLPGRTLILVDQSGSMQSKAAGALSDMNLSQVAQVFAATLAYRSEHPTLVQYSKVSEELGVVKGGEALTLTKKFWGPTGGTDTKGALDRHFRGHDRIILLTDEQHDQFHAGYWNQKLDQNIPANVKFYVWNLAGYRQAGMGGMGSANRVQLGGLTDSSFRLISMLESGSDGTWPWETGE